MIRRVRFESAERFENKSRLKHSPAPTHTHIQNANTQRLVDDGENRDRFFCLKIYVRERTIGKEVNRESRFLISYFSFSLFILNLNRQLLERNSESRVVTEGEKGGEIFVVLPRPPALDEWK